MGSGSVLSDSRDAKTAPACKDAPGQRLARHSSAHPWGSHGAKCRGSGLTSRPSLLVLSPGWYRDWRPCQQRWYRPQPPGSAPARAVHLTLRVAPTLLSRAAHQPLRPVTAGVRGSAPYLKASSGSGWEVQSFSLCAPGRRSGSPPHSQRSVRRLRRHCLNLKTKTSRYRAQVGPARQLSQVKRCAQVRRVRGRRWVTAHIGGLRLGNGAGSVSTFPRGSPCP